MRKRSVLRLLESFAWCELTPGQLLARLHGRGVEENQRNDTMPFFGLRPFCGVHTVQVSRRHLENALARKRRKELSEHELVIWATMILINDVFFWSGEDADLVVSSPTAR